jgi:hypothetical protein
MSLGGTPDHPKVQQNSLGRLTQGTKQNTAKRATIGLPSGTLISACAVQCGVLECYSGTEWGYQMLQSGSE